MTLAEVKKRLPPRTLGLFAVGAALALAFVAVCIIPYSHMIDELQGEIGRLRATVEERKQLAPVLAALNAARNDLPEVEAVVARKPLPLGDVEKLSGIMDTMARPLGLRVTRVSPDPMSVTRSQLMAVRLGLAGEAPNFRQFLLALGRYAPLVRIESVVSSVGDVGREYKVKCWLAVR